MPFCPAIAPIASNTCDGTTKDSATVFPVPPSSSDCIIACISGRDPACIFASAMKPPTTSRRLLAASSSRASARMTPPTPASIWMLPEYEPVAETRAREDHSGARNVGRCRVGMQTGDDAIDVALEVDAGRILKLALAVFLQRQRAAKSLTHVRGHDFLNVRKGDDRRVARDESKLFGPCMLREGAGGEPDVIRHEPGAETDSEHQQRDNHEIAGSRRHGKRPLDLIRDAPN